MQKEKEAKSFDDFTNLYELSKTLRFELKPVGKTQRMLEENEVFKKDKIRQEKYTKIKPYFDRLHREFVKESLQNASLDFNNYFATLKETKNNTKDTNKKIRDERRKALQDQEKELRKEMVDLFNKKAREYSGKYSYLKKKDVGIFFEERIFSLLKERYGNEKETIINGNSIFDDWKGFTGYFTKFHETRKNFYKSDGTSTAIATRAIDQNLRRFCDNLELFEKIKNKIDFSEIENGFRIKVNDVFSLGFYNKCLLRDGIDKYNKLLGGETIEKTGKKKKGINELINEYRQKSGDKLPFLKSLDKQILSEKEKFIDEIENPEEFLETLQTFYKTAEEKTEVLKTLFGDFVGNNKNYNLRTVYISKEALNTILYKWTDKTEYFEKLIFEAMKPDKPTGLKYEKKDNSYKFPNFIALEYIRTALENADNSETAWKERYYKEEKSDKGILTGNEPVWEQFLRILNFEFESLFENKIIDSKTNGETIIGHNVYKNEILKLLNSSFPIDKKSKEIIKNYADNVLRIYQIGKYFAVEKKRIWNPENLDLGDFYNNPEFGYYLKFYDNAYEDIVKNYNHLRNYLTRKPWEDNKKWKLNFENPTLANGFDKNKESSNFAVILRKNGKYYLGIMKKGSNHLFDDKNKEAMKKGIYSGKYEKMVYKYAKDVSLGIPKSSTQTKEVIAHFLTSNKDYYIEKGSSVGKFIKPLKITKEIFKINNCIYKKDDLSIGVMRGQIDKDREKEYIKMFQKEYVELGGDLKKYKESVYKWIEFCKAFLSVYPSSKFFNYSSLKNSKEYVSLDEFYSDVDALSYKISFEDISEKYIEEKNQNRELYLFEIHNKDWNLKDGKKKTGAKNLHTLYFENLFSSENENRNFVFKLNGQAELFFRPKTDKNKLEKKKDKKGNQVIDHKRYAEDKILFHCPITLNRCSERMKANVFNKRVNEFLAGNSNINIIGVDRGEKHLAYYSVITQNGKILDMGSLNEINGVDYANKLGAKAKGREQARKDWQEVEEIKELKRGYISQVVRKLADLAIQYNAIIVFEDLNMRFKQIRGGIEKSVYQQLEKALIEKLNFLVDKKEIDSQKAGHLLKAYQLTAPFETFKDMGKQTGIIFYTQANYTSITDPVIGFRKNIYISNSSSIEKIKSEINKFDEIGWDDKLKSYYFKYDAKKFNNYENSKSKEWTIYADVPRVRREKENGHWNYKNINPNEMLKKLFEIYGFDLSGNIKEQIKNKENKNELGEKEFDGKRRNFYKSFIFIFNLILQVRNSFSEDKNGKETYTDFIASPVKPFFTTENEYSKANFEDFEKKFLGKTKDRKDMEKIKKEFNGDANGAFNIARKGIIILDKIKKWFEENKKLNKKGEKENFYPDLYIPHYEWDEFVQNQ